MIRLAPSHRELCYTLLRSEPRSTGPKPMHHCPYLHLVKFHRCCILAIICILCSGGLAGSATQKCVTKQTRASRSTCTPRKHYCEMTDNTNAHVASCTCTVQQALRVQWGVFGVFVCFDLYFVDYRSWQAEICKSVLKDVFK